MFYGEDLAYVHDVGFSRRATAAVPWLVEALRRARVTGGLVVELGCGGGLTAAGLVDAGYTVWGVDRSAAMIDLARRRVPSARFRVGSIDDGDVDLPSAVAVVAVNEVFNYLPGRDLDALFGRVRGALPVAAPFLFDLAGPGRLPRGGPHRTWTTGADWAVLVEQDETDRRLVRHIETFRAVDGTYRRSVEEHDTQLYGAAEVLAALRRTGFTARVVLGYGGVPAVPGHRVYVARAAGGRPAPR